MKTSTAIPSAFVPTLPIAAAAGARRPGAITTARLVHVATGGLLAGALLLQPASAQKNAKSGGALINFTERLYGAATVRTVSGAQENQQAVVDYKTGKLGQLD